MLEIDKEFSKDISDYLKYCDKETIGEMDKHISSILKAYVDNNNFDIINISYIRNIKGNPVSLEVKVTYKNQTGETLTNTAIVI